MCSCSSSIGSSSVFIASTGSETVLADGTKTLDPFGDSSRDVSRPKSSSFPDSKSAALPSSRSLSSTTGVVPSNVSRVVSLTTSFSFSTMVFIVSLFFVGFLATFEVIFLPSKTAFARSAGRVWLVDTFFFLISAEDKLTFAIGTRFTTTRTRSRRTISSTSKTFFSSSLFPSNRTTLTETHFLSNASFNFFNPSGPIALCRKSIVFKLRLTVERPRSASSKTPLSPSEFLPTPRYFKQVSFPSASPRNFAPSARSLHPLSSNVSRLVLPPVITPENSALTPSAPIIAFERSSSRSVSDPHSSTDSGLQHAAVRLLLFATQSFSTGALVARTAAAIAPNPRSPTLLPSRCISVNDAWSRTDGLSFNAPSTPISFRERPMRRREGHRFSATQAEEPHRSPAAFPPRSSVLSDFGREAHNDSTPIPPSSEFVTTNASSSANVPTESIFAKTDPPSAPKLAPFTVICFIFKPLCQSSARSKATAPGTPKGFPFSF